MASPPGGNLRETRQDVAAIARRLDRIETFESPGGNSKGLLPNDAAGGVEFQRPGVVSARPVGSGGTGHDVAALGRGRNGLERIEGVGRVGTDANIRPRPLLNRRCSRSRNRAGENTGRQWTEQEPEQDSHIPSLREWRADAPPGANGPSRGFTRIISRATSARAVDGNQTDGKCQTLCDRSSRSAPARARTVASADHQRWNGNVLRRRFRQHDVGRGRCHRQCHDNNRHQIKYQLSAATRDDGFWPIVDRHERISALDPLRPSRNGSRLLVDFTYSTKTRADDQGARTIRRASSYAAIWAASNGMRCRLLQAQKPVWSRVELVDARTLFPYIGGKVSPAPSATDINGPSSSTSVRELACLAVSHQHVPVRMWGDCNRIGNGNRSPIPGSLPHSW